MLSKMDVRAALMKRVGYFTVRELNLETNGQSDGVEFNLSLNRVLENRPIPVNGETSAYDVDVMLWNCTIVLLSGSSNFRLIFSKTGFITALFSPRNAKTGPCPSKG